jgi:2-polyprenyl-3-methyl-5-hydroxy-6-metoxy-1,4-benzoquinol methylase
MTINPHDADSFGVHRQLGSLVSRQLEISPRHSSFFSRRFSQISDSELRLCNELSRQILKLSGGEIDAFFRGYDFICDILKQEEVYFRRNDAYRLKTVRQATDEVYDNPSYMQNYMRGLLMTQVFWSNHTAAMRFYIDEFLARNSAGYDLLEIGPGHGLLFYRAVADQRARSLTGWDLSEASISETRDALRKLGVARPYKLEVRDLLRPNSARESFDTVVLSEVLEHMEVPARALDAIGAILRPGARFYINVPINSPAPDHIFLFRSPEEVVALVESRGFSVERTGFFPATNYSLDAAIRHKLTISVCMVVTKPDISAIASRNG